MATCDDCFQEFEHPLVHAGMVKNDAFKRCYIDRPRWDWDDSSAILAFSGPDGPTVRIHCSVVGTTQGNKWQWSWTNKNIPLYAKIDVEKGREFGEKNGCEKLTTAFLKADEYTGWKMTSVTEHILEDPGAHRFPTDHGSCYLA
jgi:hypothetical protein